MERSHRVVTGSAAAFSVLLLAACGGGSGKFASALPPAGGTSSASAAPASRPAVYVGACDFCNYRSGPTGQLDGGEAETPSADLFVVARGLDRGPATGTAYGTFDARTALVGPVTAVDVARGEIRVGAERVRGFGPWLATSATARPYAGPVAVSIADLQPGDRVRVLGYPVADGATYGVGLRRATAVDADRVAGFASVQDAVARRIVIGATSVDYRAARLENLSSDAIPPGAPVEAIGHFDAGGVLVADVLRRRVAPTMEPGTLLTVRGALVRLAVGASDVADVEIAGQPLRFASRCVGDVVPGDFVRATGVVRDDGVVDSTALARCSISRGEESSWYGTLTAELQSIDASDLVLAGATLRLQPETRFASADGARLPPAALRPGDRVAVGLWPSAAPGHGFAASVLRLGAGTPAGEPAIYVDAFLGQAASDAIDFLARPVRLDANTGAGQRACNPGDPLVALDYLEFMRRTFFGPDSTRSIRMSLAIEPSGGWRALTVESFATYYCD